jgi:hypothetical protein
VSGRRVVGPQVEDLREQRAVCAVVARVALQQLLDRQDEERKQEAVGPSGVQRALQRVQRPQPGGDVDARKLATGGAARRNAASTARSASATRRRATERTPSLPSTTIVRSSAISLAAPAEANDSRVALRKSRSRSAARQSRTAAMDANASRADAGSRTITKSFVRTRIRARTPTRLAGGERRGGIIGTCTPFLVVHVQASADAVA